MVDLEIEINRGPGKWTGEVNWEGKPHGMGIFEYKGPKNIIRKGTCKEGIWA